MLPVRLGRPEAVRDAVHDDADTHNRDQTTTWVFVPWTCIVG
jgi:hypothetical protein